MPAELLTKGSIVDDLMVSGGNALRQNGLAFVAAAGVNIEIGMAGGASTSTDSDSVRCSGTRFCRARPSGLNNTIYRKLWGDENELGIEARLTGAVDRA